MPLTRLPLHVVQTSYQNPSSRQLPDDSPRTRSGYPLDFEMLLELLFEWFYTIMSNSVPVSPPMLIKHSSCPTIFICAAILVS